MKNKLLPHRRVRIRSKRFLILVIAMILIVTLLGIGLGLNFYRNNQSNKIYSVGQSMRFPGFTVSVTNTKVKAINLPLDKDTIAKYGDIGTDENCDISSKDPTPRTGYRSIFGKTYTPPLPSPYNFCIRRNESRKYIKDYSASNKQVTLNFTIKAQSIVLTKDIRIEMLPDSGRNLSAKVDNLNANEFMFGNLNNENNGSYEETPYVPYSQSDLSGNVNPGLTRNGYIYTDVRNAEHIVDFGFTYNSSGKQITRITRLSLN